MTINYYDACYNRNSSSKDIKEFFKLEISLILATIVVGLILI